MFIRTVRTWLLHTYTHKNTNPCPASYDPNDHDSCRWQSPEEVQLREHVYEVNRRHGVTCKSK